MSVFVSTAIDKPDAAPGDVLTLTVVTDGRVHNLTEQLVIDGKPPISLTGTEIDPETVSDAGASWGPVSDDGATAVYQAKAPATAGVHTVSVACDGEVRSVAYTVTVPISPLLVGAAVGATASFAAANALIGPLQAMRVFYSGALPATYAQMKLPVPGWVSYKASSSNTVPFAKDCPPGARIIPHHEPENDYGSNGAAYVAWYVNEYELIKAANPAVKVGPAAMTYQYGIVAGGGLGNGASGTYMPPADKVDFYACDNYENKPTGAGLAKDQSFLGWYNLVKGRGKPLAFAEYGVGVNPIGYTVDQWATQRAATMAVDAAWIAKVGGFEALLYWYFTGNAGDWRYTDPGSVTAWQTNFVKAG